MPKVWSFNTTVRNPERVQTFLRILSEFEGENFDASTQEKFFMLQIKKRRYKPNASTLIDKDLVDEVNRKSADDIPDDITERIVDIYRQKKDANAAMRGRTTAGILNRFGLCVALESKGPVVITQLGKDWLEGNIDDQDLFLRFLLKWQYTNFIEDGYGGFDIKPFVGTLHLINKVNTEWAKLGNDPVGLSKDEFILFIPSLSHYSEINDAARAIIDYRKNAREKSGKERTKYLEKYAKNRVKEIFGGSKDFSLAMRDLNDYRDSAIKYFRVTKFVYKRGYGHLDIAPDYRIEISRLLSVDDASSVTFKDYSEYFDYLSDISLPILSWVNDKDLAEKSKELQNNCKNLVGEVKTISDTEFKNILDSIQKDDLPTQVRRLEDIKNKLRIDSIRSIKYDSEKMIECISGINNSIKDKAKIITTRPSLDLEWFVSLSLMVMNDSLDIIPSIKLGDDGIPTGFRGGLSDVECYYNSFKMIVEVTLLNGRDQWIQEGQPVMRHLRDFEDKTGTRGDAYCLFIAPYLHRDTVNTYWNSVLHGYEGAKQRIIPLTVEQYINILSVINDKIVAANFPTQHQYKALLDDLYDGYDSSADVYEWMGGFDSKIENWSKNN